MMAAGDIFFWREDNVQTGHFSEWYYSEFREDDGTKFVTVEQYKTYQKAKLMKDEETAAKVLKTENPKEHKALGKKIQNWNAKVWRQHAEAIVYRGNLLKFKQNSRLAHRLNITGQAALINAHPYDPVWGIGLTDFDSRRFDRANWKGQNRLGVILERVRTELRRQGILGAPLRLTNIETGQVVCID